jgi:peroxiredoxin
MTIRTGDKAADFSLPSLLGPGVRLSDYHGKKVVLFMWASW